PERDRARFGTGRRVFEVDFVRFCATSDVRGEGEGALGVGRDIGSGDWGPADLPAGRRGADEGDLHGDARAGADGRLDVALGRELFERGERDDARDAEVAGEGARAGEGRAGGEVAGEDLLAKRLVNAAVE